MPSRRCFLMFTAAAATAWARRPGESATALLEYAGSNGKPRPVHSVRDWRHRRAHILESLQEVMGPLPAKSRTPPRVETVETIEGDRFTRRRIRYEAEPGDWVPAWLLLPRTSTQGKAAVCLHQTVRIGKDEPVGLGGKPNLRYAAELAERGYITIAPDYPTFGDYKIDVYAKGYRSATMKGIHNHRRAVDLLCSMKAVNPKRIAVIGHSLGGHNSLFLAAFEERIQAAVTSCGFTAFPKYYGGNLTGWSHKGYMPRIAEAYDKSPARMPFDFTEILAAIAPRAVFINAPTRDANFEVTGVDDCVAAARPVYDKVFRRPDALVLEHPEAEHDFPTPVRERAYAFLDRLL